MQYPVECECGKTHKVDGTLAGSLLACSSGCDVDVPSLSRLKSSVGQAALSLDVRIKQMLRLGMLPEETKCLLFRNKTQNIAYCWALCEKLEVQSAPAKGLWALTGLLTLFFGVLTAVLVLLHLFRRGDNAHEHGCDVRFGLPLRICEPGMPDLHAHLMLRNVVLEVPIYAELLERYPHSKFALEEPKEKVVL